MDGVTRSEADAEGAARRSIAFVMAHGFEHDSERVEPECGEVGRRVLRELLRVVHYLSSEFCHAGMNGADC